VPVYMGNGAKLVKSNQPYPGPAVCRQLQPALCSSIQRVSASIDTSFRLVPRAQQPTMSAGLQLRAALLTTPGLLTIMFTRRLFW